MERKGTSILTGTLLLSLFLAPAVKSRLSSSGDSNGSAGTQQTANMQHAASPGEAGAWSDQERQDVENQANSDYEDELNYLLCGKKAAGSCQFSPNEFIVAIVPDPIHSHLALEFDREVEAIEEAVQDEGYMFDRAIMPWDTKVHPDSDDFKKRLRAAWYQQARERHPGLLIFRGDQAHSGKILFVLVVTETPTGGIKRPQFEKAIGIIHNTTGQDLSQPESWGWKKSDPQCTTSAGQSAPECVPRGLRIVGPTFSGSLASLRDELKKHNWPLVSIHANVGSHQDMLAFEREMQPKDVHLASFLESSDVVTQRFIEYLTGTAYLDRSKKTWFGQSRPERRNYRTKNFALLSEDESAYGKIQHAQGNKDNAQAGGKSDVNCDSQENAGTQDCMLKLYFPREISQLRAAYQRDMAGAGDGNPNVPRDILRAAPDVPGSDDDTVPAYSAKQMPLSQEAVMLGIVSELRRHSSQYILIRGSDPLDELFLTRYLRTAYPQGRIVTIGADMLFRREAEDPRLHGVLALTTYSVNPSANHNYKSYEENHIERVFPSPNDVGTYNAMRSLLTAWVDDLVFLPDDIEHACKQSQDLPPPAGKPGCRHILRRHPEVGDPTPPSLKLYQYGWTYEVLERNIQNPKTVDQAMGCPPIQFDAPPVRLLALGRDDYWPVAVLGPYAPDEKTPCIPKWDDPLASTLPRIRDQLVEHDLEPVSVPKSWRIVQFVSIVLGVGFAVCLWFSSVFSPSQTLAKYAPCENDSRRWLLVIGGLALMLSMLILLWPALHGAEARLPIVDGSLAASILLVCFTIIIELASRWMLSVNLVRSSEAHRRRWRGGVPLACFIFFAALFAWRATTPLPETSSLTLRFTTLRSIQLASGLSFIMPGFFLLAVWLWCADHIIAGCVLLDHRRPRLPDSMNNDRVRRLLPENLDGLDDARALRFGVRGRLYGLMAVLVIGAFWLLGDRAHPLFTLERPFLEWALMIFLSLAIVGILAVTLRLAHMWRTVRQLLVALDSLPLRRGFRHLQGFSWDPIWRLGAGSLEEFRRMFSREQEALECALNTARLQAPKLGDSLKAIKRAYDLARSAPNGFTTGWLRRRTLELQLVRQFGTYQREVALLAGKALDYAASDWACHREGPTPWDENAAAVKPAVRACERFICLVYIGYLLVVLVRIRTLAVAIAGMYVLTLLAVSQYPFEPKGALQLMLVLLLVFIVSVVGCMYAQMHRDATLSAITDTSPGELGLDFFIRMASFVALPLFSLVASQFPSLNRFFYSWFQPAIEALNR